MDTLCWTRWAAAFAPLVAAVFVRSPVVWPGISGLTSYGGGRGSPAVFFYVEFQPHSPERPASIAPSQVGGEHTDIQPRHSRVDHTRQMDCAAEQTRTARLVVAVPTGTALAAAAVASACTAVVAASVATLLPLLLYLSLLPQSVLLSPWLSLLLLPLP